jgi:hypothetical protein
MNMRARFHFVIVLLLITLAGRDTQANTAPTGDRCAFIGRKEFSDFTTTATEKPGIVEMISPELAVPIAWDELVASWNVPPGVYLKLEARAIFPDHTTKYYTLGLWSDDPAAHPRASVSHQRDDDGTVKQDTLVLAHHGGKVQVRITLGGDNSTNNATLKFLGLSFCNSDAHPPAREPNHAAWGKTIEVPERRQAEYKEEKGWCSPTSLSMVLAYWSDAAHRPELNHTELEVAHAVQDSGMDGTGNWPFNTAYAGTFPGVRAYVTRLDDISELEDWIADGIAPIISVSSYLTNDRHSGPDNGHLIVCVGFTEQGDFVANDPGVSVKRNIRARRVYPRERVINAWKKSKNAVYLVYPENATIPKNVSGHWDDGDSKTEMK